MKMSKMRQLDKEERQATERGIKIVKDRIEELEYGLGTVVRDINKGLFLKLRAALRKQKQNLRDIKAELGLEKSKLVELEKQLKFGVKIKRKRR